MATQSRRWNNLGSLVDAYARERLGQLIYS